MVKKIKLPLEMANGVTVRTIEELKENWDLEKIVFYYNNGRLLTWLNDRYYCEQAEQLKMLQTVTDSQEMQKQLCSIFEMPFSEEACVNVEALAVKNKKLEKLRKLTSDDEILKNVDKVAFNQEELTELLDRDVSVIYLVENTFTIPLSKKNKTYIGIGQATAFIDTKEIIDFEKLGIVLINVMFNKEYATLIDSKESQVKADNLYEKDNYNNSNIGNKINNDIKIDSCMYDNYKSDAEVLYLEGKHCLAFPLFIDMAKEKNARAMYFLGEYYRWGYGSVVAVNSETGFAWHKRGSELGDALAGLNVAYCFPKGSEEREKTIRNNYEMVKMQADNGDVIAQNEMADLLLDGSVIDKDIPRAIDYLSNSAEGGNWRSAYKLGCMYRDGNYVKKNSEEALFYFKMSAIREDVNGQMALAWMNLGFNGIVANADEAIKWYLKAADNGCATAFTSLGEMYRLGNAVQINYNEALKWYRKAIELGDNGAYSNMGKLYEFGLKNLTEARNCYKKAVELGVPYAKSELTMFEKEHGCFITTAVCASLCKLDDCDELMTMRWLRDKLKKEDPDMAVLINEYYRVAPLLVKKINSFVDAPTVYRRLWDNYISKIYGYIKQKDYHDAKLRYISMLEDLCERYNEPLAHGIKEKIEKVRMKKIN